MTWCERSNHHCPINQHPSLRTRQLSHQNRFLLQQPASGVERQGGPEALPFMGGLRYVAITISLYLMPHHYTLWQAASSERTQAFLLVSTLFHLPVTLTYIG